MNKQFYLLSFFSLSIIVGIAGCKRDAGVIVSPIVTRSHPAKLYIQVDNMVGDEALVLNDAKSYVNENHDTFTVNDYRYYISNIKLTHANGSVFEENYSYHLIDASSAKTCKFGIAGVP